jgi:hypothetical protein
MYTTAVVTLTVVGLAIVTAIAKALGWQICLGIMIGYVFAQCAFRYHFGRWADFG